MAVVLWHFMKYFNCSRPWGSGGYCAAAEEGPAVTDRKGKGGRGCRPMQLALQVA